MKVTPFEKHENPEVLLDDEYPLQPIADLPKTNKPAAKKSSNDELTISSTQSNGRLKNRRRKQKQIDRSVDQFYVTDKGLLSFTGLKQTDPVS